MSYALATDGDAIEMEASRRFARAEFPAYERYWLTHVVPVTDRPKSLQLLDNAVLIQRGKTEEDVAIAQLHYTVLWHLLSAWKVRQQTIVGSQEVLVGLSFLCGALDVAFEVLQRSRSPGRYDPWAESTLRGGKRSGQQAQEDWKKFDNYPLGEVRGYRNKLLHGRTAPMIMGPSGALLPAMDKVDSYVDWRLITGSTPATSAARDFVPATAILDDAWKRTIAYLESAWVKHLGV